MDLAAFSGADALRNPAGVSWRQFQEVSHAVRIFLDTNQPLGPGDRFGPCAGRVKGTAVDFLFGDIALLFVSSEAFASLNHSEVVLPLAAPICSQKTGTPDETVLEFDIPRAGTLSDESYGFLPHRCGTCGRIDGRLERPVLVSDSRIASLDLFRPTNHPSIIIASDRFRLAAADRSLTGLVFEPIEIAIRDV